MFEFDGTIPSGNLLGHRLDFATLGAVRLPSFCLTSVPPHSFSRDIARFELARRFVTPSRLPDEDEPKLVSPYLYSNPS